jgi:hypothetical protein
LIFLKDFVVARNSIPPGRTVESPVKGRRGDFYSVGERQEINDNNSNNSARRGSPRGQSAAVRRVACRHYKASFDRTARTPNRTPPVHKITASFTLAQARRGALGRQHVAA